MALNKSALKASLKAALQSEMPSPTADQIAAYDRIAGAMSDAIDAFVKGATVNVTVAQGIPVATAGTAAAQTGVTTAAGSGTGTLS